MTPLVCQVQLSLNNVSASSFVLLHFFPQFKSVVFLHYSFQSSNHLSKWTQNVFIVFKYCCTTSFQNIPVDNNHVGKQIHKEAYVYYGNTIYINVRLRNNDKIDRNYFLQIEQYWSV